MRQPGATTTWMRGLAAALLLLVAALPAAAEVDPARLDGAKRAADEFLRRAEGSAGTGRMPRRTDPEIARLLDAAFDLSIASARPVPMAKIGPVGELALNGNRIGTAYILAGTGRTEVPADDREVLAKVDRNTVAFAPEVGQFTDFQLGVTEVMARSALDFAAGAPPEVLAQPRVVTGLAQMRGGFARTIGGVMKTLVIPGLDEGWKLGRLAAIESVSGTASRFLGESDKAGVGEVAREVAAVIEPGLRPRLEAVARGLVAPAP